MKNTASFEPTGCSTEIVFRPIIAFGVSGIISIDMSVVVIIAHMAGLFGISI